MPHAPCLPHTP